jgi:hypothetical protein
MRILKTVTSLQITVLWIRLGFNADPNAAFFFFTPMRIRMRLLTSMRADAMWIHANLDPGQTFTQQKVEF